MIYFNIAWDTQKNIGKAYNNFMRLLPSDNDFACFIDSDAMFTTPFFGKQLEDIVTKYPECRCFTAMTNRVGSLWQLQPYIDWDNNDIKYHRKKGEILQLFKYNIIEDVSDKGKEEGEQVMSGVLILIKKSLWKKIGGFKEDKMLGIDSDLHWRIQKHNEKLYLMKGVYVYHWYRGGNRTDKKHLL